MKTCPTRKAVIQCKPLACHHLDFVERHINYAQKLLVILTNLMKILQVEDISTAVLIYSVSQKNSPDFF